MWTKLQNNPRKKAPRKVAVIDPYSCFGAFACSICQAACPVEDCIVEEKDENDRWVWWGILLVMWSLLESADVARNDPVARST